MKTIRYTADAAKAIKRHANVAARLRSKISELALIPTPQANNVKPLVGVDAKRLRVGDFRVIFTETETEILILTIAPRGGAYD